MTATRAKLPILTLRTLAVLYLAACGSALGGSPSNLPTAPAVAGLGSGFTSGSVQANGIKLHYVRGGTGPTVLLLHGFPEDWSAYRKVMPHLGRKFTVVAVDLPGIGGSTAKPGSYSAVDMAADIRQLQEQLHLRHVYLVGHDVGAMVAYAFVRRYPQALRGAMILDAPLPGLPPWKEFIAQPFVWHIHFQQVPGLPEELVTGRQTAYFRYFLDPVHFSDAAVARYAESYATPEQLHAAFEIYRAFPADAKFNASRHDRIDVPLVLVAGSESPVAKNLPAIAKALRAHGCTNVRLGVVQGSSHFIADEQPSILSAYIEKYASP